MTQTAARIMDQLKRKSLGPGPTGIGYIYYVFIYCV